MQEDDRIFHKECASLAESGYETYQISCGKTYDNKGVHLIGVGNPASNRLLRLVKTRKTVYKEALKLDADVYHFHDPELLPYGLRLKKKGKRVIFDSHEDVPGQILDKYWIPVILRKLVSRVYRSYETYVVKQLDAVVTATPYIGEKFRSRTQNVVVVNNYPRLDDIVFHDISFDDRESVVCYAGGIDELRGESIMIAAMKAVAGKLVIAGDHDIEEFDKVKYVGRLNRKGVNDLYGSSVVGLCILKPIENYYHSRPIKVYEYMAAGLPYICSNFPDWIKVAEESGAGICVDPSNIEEISNAISKLLSDRDKSREMGCKGREYVIKYCNWANEEISLLALYDKIGNNKKDEE